MSLSLSIWLLLFHKESQPQSHMYYYQQGKSSEMPQEKRVFVLGNSIEISSVFLKDHFVEDINSTQEQIQSLN